jgi:hypothetical protein
MQGRTADNYLGLLSGTKITIITTAVLSPMLTSTSTRAASFLELLQLHLKFDTPDTTSIDYKIATTILVHQFCSGQQLRQRGILRQITAITRA